MSDENLSGGAELEQLKQWYHWHQSGTNITDSEGRPYLDCKCGNDVVGCGPENTIISLGVEHNRQIDNAIDKAYCKGLHDKDTYIADLQMQLGDQEKLANDMMLERDVAARDLDAANEENETLSSKYLREITTRHSDVNFLKEQLQTAIEDKERLIKLIEGLRFWLQGSLNCKSHIWEPDQREYAEETVRAAIDQAKKEH
jgi:hypothetical protein